MKLRIVGHLATITRLIRALASLIRAFAYLLAVLVE